MPTRVSILFDVTTAPADLTSASPHSGGWSESHWKAGTLAANDPFLDLLIQYRARLLPSYAAAIGARLETFSISTNKLIPGGTTGFRKLYPGGGGNSLNLPNDALQCSGQSATSPNSNRFNLRCLPDAQISLGEYQPTSAFRAAVAGFLDQLVSNQWGFIGRDLSATSERVLNVKLGADAQHFTIQTSESLGAPQGSFVRLLRVYDDNNNPIVGSFLVTATDAVNFIYTLLGSITVGRSTPSGLARRDGLAFFAYGGANPQRAVARKIGRPFELYRGRKSKTRA